ncbi:hypothetical protein ABN584_10990 [Gloeocapsa sp. BRSZ]
MLNLIAKRIPEEMGIDFYYQRMVVNRGCHSPSYKRSQLLCT